MMLWESFFIIVFVFVLTVVVYFGNLLIRELKAGD